MFSILPLIVSIVWVGVATMVHSQGRVCNKPKEEISEVRVYRTVGKCNQFNKINRGVKDKNYCVVFTKTKDEYFICTRRVNHTGYHHSHTDKVCILIW